MCGFHVADHSVYTGVLPYLFGWWTITFAADHRPLGPAVFIAYSYKRDGDTMWVTQQRNQNGPFANPVTVKVVRVE